MQLLAQRLPTGSVRPVEAHGEAVPDRVVEHLAKLLLPARGRVAALGLLDTGAEEGVQGVPVGLVDPAGVLEQQLTGGSGTVREIRTDVPDKLDGDVRAASASIPSRVKTSRPSSLMPSTPTTGSLNSAARGAHARTDRRSGFPRPEHARPDHSPPAIGAQDLLDSVAPADSDGEEPR
jgi:hypothetical protein